MFRRKSIKFLSVLALSFLALPLFAQAGVEKQALRWSSGNSISDYLEQHKNAKYPMYDIAIKAVSYVDSENADIAKLDNYNGRENVLS